MDYYDKLEHYNPCFNQYCPNWGNSYVYSLDNQCEYNDYLCFYNYQSKFVQLESKPS